MTILLVTHGASRQAQQWSQRYQQWFSEQGADVLMLSTVVNGDVDILRLHQLLERANEVVVLGGDGTLHWLINQLTEEQAQRLLISIVPCGTGNDFARDMSLTSPAWRMCSEQQLSQQPIDIGEVNGIRFINAASQGLTADLVARQSIMLKRWLGRFSYLVGVLSWWLRYRYNDPKQSVLNSVLIGAYLGGGIKLAPDAKRQGGQLTQIIVKAAPKWRLLGVLWDVLRANHAQNPLVSVEQRGRFVLPPSVLEIDGECYIMTMASEVTVLEQFIKVRRQRRTR